MPKTTATTDDPEALRQQAADLAERQAAVIAEINRVAAADAERRARAQHAFDEAMVASYSRRALDEQLEQARRKLQEQLEADPLVNAIAAYVTASRRHRHLVTEHVSAKGRLGEDVSSFVAPHVETLTIQDLLVSVVERIAEQRVDAERQELHQRREAAGNDTKEKP